VKSLETDTRRINIYLWETLVLDVCYNCVVISVLCLSAFITVCILFDTKFVNKKIQTVANYISLLLKILCVLSSVLAILQLWISHIHAPVSSMMENLFYCFDWYYITPVSKWLLWGQAVAQLVEALCYELERRGFDSRWCHWDFPLTLSFRPHYGPGVDSASNRNKYQEYFLGVKVAGA
jgi:hypothetical protein